MNRCLEEATIPDPVQLFMQPLSERIVEIYDRTKQGELIFTWNPGYLTALTSGNTL